MSRKYGGAAGSGSRRRGMNQRVHLLCCPFNPHPSDKRYDRVRTT